MAKKINSAVFPGLQGGPLMHVIAAKAVALAEALPPGFQGLREETLSTTPAHSPPSLSRWASTLFPAAPTTI